MGEWGKHYKTLKEFIERKAYFDEVAVKMKLHNNLSKSKFRMGHNQMSDWSIEEYQRFLGKHKKPDIQLVAENSPKLFKFQETIDWRKSGVIDEVGNQYQCTSDWAFAAVTAVAASQALNGDADLEALSQ